MSRTFGLLIFDLDGVLVDTTPAHARAYDDLWRHIGITGPGYAEIAGRKTVDVVTEVAGARAHGLSDVAAWVRFKQDRARQYLRTENIEFEDARPIIDALMPAPLMLAVGTGASRETTEIVLARTGYRNAFTVVVTGDDVALGKPAPEVYQKVIAEAAAEPSKTRVIEDSVAGLRAALDAGASAISVRTFEQVQHPDFLGAFPDLTALPDILGLARV